MADNKFFLCLHQALQYRKLDFCTIRVSPSPSTVYLMSYTRLYEYMRMGGLPPGTNRASKKPRPKNFAVFCLEQNKQSVAVYLLGLPVDCLFLWYSTVAAPVNLTTERTKKCQVSGVKGGQSPDNLDEGENIQMRSIVTRNTEQIDDNEKITEKIFRRSGLLPEKKKKGQSPLLLYS